MLKLNLAVSSYCIDYTRMTIKSKYSLLLYVSKYFVIMIIYKYQINRRLLRNFMIKIVKIKAVFYIVQINRRTALKY